MDASIPMPDGRQLAYREYGDPAGFPVLHCHGGLVCGLDVAPAATAARALGLRLIAPDRPGIGASSPQLGRDLAAFARDAGALADGLGLAEIGVLGWSMGGQYALALAHGLAGRVSRTAVVAGCLPLTDPANLARLNAMDRRFTEMARHHPHEAEAAFHALGETARRSPAAYNELSARGLAAADADQIHALPAPGLAGMAAPALASAAGQVEEYRAWALDWGFSLAAVPGPVDVWQGDADTLVPPEWAATLASGLPNASLHLVPGAGHFVAYGRWEEVLGGFGGGR
jgi:pimeloyl-ACP methyl ester carboxylesterase